MKIGIVGYQGSGKSALFQWLTGLAVDPAHAHQGHVGMAAVPDPRIDPLCAIYRPKKVTLAALELVDTPGLSRTHEGNAARLGLLREAGCLVIVVAAFGGVNPPDDLRRLDEDLLLADMAIVSGRIDRLQVSLKKPRPTRDQEIAELEVLKPLLAEMEHGRPISRHHLTEEQARHVRQFGLLTAKPELVVFNVADDDQNPQQWIDQAAASYPQRNCVALAAALQLELDRMSEQDREELVREMELPVYDRAALLRTILDASGQILFFTAGDKEVRSWMLPRGGTALDAAAGIHSDMARGFIRAEVIASDDLIRLGSEREAKAHHALRQEPKDYTVQDGELLLIKFNV